MGCGCCAHMFIALAVSPASARPANKIRGRTSTPWHYCGPDSKGCHSCLQPAPPSHAFLPPKLIHHFFHLSIPHFTCQHYHFSLVIMNHSYSADSFMSNASDMATNGIGSTFGPQMGSQSACPSPLLILDFDSRHLSTLSTRLNLYFSFSYLSVTLFLHLSPGLGQLAPGSGGGLGSSFGPTGSSAFLPGNGGGFGLGADLNGPPSTK